MPYAAKFNYDDPNKPQNVSGTQGAEAVGIPGQESSKPQKGSGQYANIQSYLEANKDQGAQMGEKVAGDVESKATDAQGRVSAFQSVAPKVNAYDPNEAYSRLNNLDDETKTQYNTAKAGYKGPDSVEQIGGYTDAAKASQEAYQKVKNAGNELGQQELLKQSYARPQYSAGENRLDQVLLQNAPGSKQKLEGLSQKYAGLDNLFKNASESAGNQLAEAKRQALLNQQAIQTGEESQWKGLIDPIKARADQMNIDNPALVNRITQDASDEILSKEALEKLGLNVGQRTYGLNLQNYLNPNIRQLGLSDAATAEERAKFQALNALTGAGRSDIGEAEAYNPLSFDRARFDQDFTAADKAFRERARQQNFSTTIDGNELDFGNGPITGQFTGEISLMDFLNQNEGRDYLSGDYRNFILPESTNVGYVPASDGEIDTGRFEGADGGKIGGSDPVVDKSLESANNRVKEQLYNQIRNYLNSQNYGTAIKEG